MDLKTAVRRAVNGLLAPAGLEIRRRGVPESPSADRATLEGMLAQARSVGFIPGTVVDVGAAYGSLTRACRAVFPSCGVVLVEPIAEYRPHLERLARSIPGARFVEAAAAAAGGSVTIHVHTDLVGSSLFLEDEGTDVNGVPREVPSTTLDAIDEAAAFAPPVLIKLDVQGAELDVLRGAERVLEATELIIVETSLFRVFHGGPLLHEVVDHLARRGFVVYDVAGQQYRPLDGALIQVDLAFVRDAGPFRALHQYATPEQRAEQDRRFARSRRPRRFVSFRSLMMCCRRCKKNTALTIDL